MSNGYCTSSSSSTANTLVVLNFPDNFLLGIDLKYWTSAPCSKFQGVRDIPNGVHYVYYCKSEDCPTERCGFFVFFDHSNPTSCIRKWCSDTEMLVPLGDRGEEERIAEMALLGGDFKPYQATYPTEVELRTKWDKLSNYLSPLVLGVIESVKVQSDEFTTVVDENKNAEYIDIGTNGGSSTLVKEENVETSDPEGGCNDNNSAQLMGDECSAEGADTNPSPTAPTAQKVAVVDVLDRTVGEFEIFTQHLLPAVNYEAMDQMRAEVQWSDIPNVEVSIYTRF
jgi:hypothetical protein